MKYILSFLSVILLTVTLTAQDLLRDQHYSASNLYKAITLEDYDGDGIPEVWAGNSANNHIGIWTYSQAKDSLVMIDSIYDGFPAPPSFIHDIDAADLDGDGDVDAVAAFRSYGTYLCINEGSGTWTVSQLDNTYGWQTIIDDYDQDGNLDIFISTDWNFIKIYYGDGAGSFTAGAVPPNPHTYGASHGMNSVDFNHDGYPDLIGIDWEWDQSGTDEYYLRAYINKLSDATPEWSYSVAPEDVLGTYTTTGVKSVNFSAADFNNDGNIDLVYFSPDNNYIVAMMGGESNGSYTWTPDTVVNYSASFVAVSAFDIDGDNDMDIIAGGRDKFEGILILYNDGNGNFTQKEAELGFGAANFHDMVMGDIDGNGMNDLILSQYDMDNGTDDGFHVFFLKKDLTRLYVNSAATGKNDGSSWQDAFTDLQTALEYADPGDSIWVAAGTYLPSADADGITNPSDARTKTFSIPDSVFVFGGFSGNETEFDQRDWKHNETILSGDIGVVDDSSDNCYNVVRGHDYAVLDGFTITGGNADNNAANETNRAGGVLNINVKNVRIANCIFENNFALQGGGISNYFCTGEIYIEHCTFYKNVAANGGAIGNFNTKAIIKYCLFVENVADDDIVTDWGMGGAIYNWGSGSTSEQVNCTFINNKADNGTSIHNRGVNTTCKNSIFWENTGSDDIANTNGSVCTVTYCDIAQADYVTGTGCFDEDPQFCVVNDLEYKLLPSSPCIDAGDPDAAYNDPDNTRNDLGAGHVISYPISITTQPQAQTVNQGETLTLKFKAEGDVSAYQWYKDGVALINNGNISGANDTVLTIINVALSDAGSYFGVALGTCDTMCTDTVVVEVVDLTAVNSASDNVTVYPNPADNYLFVKAQGLKSIVVSDLAGKILIRQKTVSDNVAIDISRFKQGVYIIRIETSDGIIVKKICKN